MTFRLLAFWLVLIGLAAPSLGHGGGLDRHGCHTNRKTGDYHCHRGSRANPRPPADAQGLFSNPRAVGTPGRESPASRTQLVLAAQLLLNSLGYEVGSVDGVVGRRTAEAIRRFQQEHGLRVDGKVTGTLLVNLSQQVRACSLLPSESFGD